MARSTKDGVTTPRSREGTLDGHVRSIELDQNGIEIAGEDEDGKITEQARNLKMLNQYQQDILRLQNEKEQLLRQAAAHNRSEQIQRELREAKIKRDRLVREIQGLQGARATTAIHAGGNIEIPGDNFVQEDKRPI